MTRLWYGGDYNPEQWDPQVWKEDADLMRQAGVNLVTVGVFSWSSLEPSPGEYRFGWLDQVLDLLHAAGVSVDLATPTASPPPWFSRLHPEALPVTADGVRLTHGSRDTYCACAPAYRSAATGIARALVDRYGDHPSLAMWHVHNEYGTVCYCPLAAERFREWLRERYGSLDRLNAAWTTAFWSQGYSGWQDVQPPRRTQYLVNPTQFLDYRRFWSDELLAAYLEQKAVIRERSSLPVTTNFVFGGWVPVNHARWAAEVDVVAIDHYPTRTDAGAEEQTAFGADLARSWAGGRPWLLMEQAAGTLDDGKRLHTKEPGRMARHSLSHIARGSAGALFFQWRASRGGSEVYHSALVPHAGPSSRIFREVVALGSLLPSLAEVADAEVVADVAVLWDVECWWAMQGTHLPSSSLDYLSAVQDAHRHFWRAGVTVDFAEPSADLSSYRLVVVPSLYLISDEAAASLAAYVERGGQLVVGYFSGIVDPDARVRLGGYPGAFTALLGVRVEEFHPLTEDGEVQLSSGGRGRVWSEDVEAVSAEVVDRYVGGVLDGKPAITRRRVGAGIAWYVSTSVDVDTAAGLFGLTGSAVETVRRRSGDTTWTFLVNHGASEVVVPIAGVELISGSAVDGSLALAGGGVAVVRSP
ncbi:beta-galactosidase [Kribbella turkmenica]|uniref:Beta-galactosidase n=1 Tax=Kribbella turkmenica TaxID=2530375 RepID=A0A4R4XG15_9ACTN|nr:beta-galactosidase [Kribbella turkmenica]TDD29670.1 beta-galactosidase [Kribbella turkmenica]